MLPDKVREVLKSTRRCCLGTINGQEPYLSLMVFTFVEDEELLVMSSRGESNKVRNLQQNPRAAVLIHEDEQLADPVSITLIGTVRLEAGASAEKYLALHQQAHPGSAPFTGGEGMAVLTFVPQRAVLADRRDQVTYWER